MADDPATKTCPDGHESVATDWCDTCGVAMAGAPAVPGAPPTGAPAAAGTCSNCGTEHLQGEAFCEVCGLDFATGQLPKVAAPEPAEVEASVEAEGAPSTVVTSVPGWSVVVDADRAWFDHNEAESGSVVEYPKDGTGRTVPLTGDVVTIGRRDDKRGWYPAIDLGVPVLDPSTSRKHAELRASDGAWSLVDLDSTNGTTVDGERLTTGDPVLVKDGTIIHVGAFTRITVSAPAEEGA